MCVFIVTPVQIIRFGSFSKIVLWLFTWGLARDMDRNGDGDNGGVPASHAKLEKLIIDTDPGIGEFRLRLFARMWVKRKRWEFRFFFFFLVASDCLSCGWCGICLNEAENGWFLASICFVFLVVLVLGFFFFPAFSQLPNGVQSVLFSTWIFAKVGILVVEIYCVTGYLLSFLLKKKKIELSELNW